MVNHLPDNIDKGLSSTVCVVILAPCNDARMIFTGFPFPECRPGFFSSKENSTSKHPVMAQGQGQIHPLRQRKRVAAAFI